MPTSRHTAKVTQYRRELEENPQQVALKETRFFDPIRIGNIKLAHRVVLTPLETLNPSLPRDLPNKEEFSFKYYEERSQRAGTLIITEAAFPDCTHQHFDLLLGVWSPRQLTIWQEIFQRIHNKNSAVFVQLWYMGINSSHPLIHSKNLLYNPKTDIFYNNDDDVHGCSSQFGISRAGIKLYVRDFVEACKKLVKVGADGIVIPGTDRFFSLLTLPQSNFRDDEYGGSIENRSRFILEVVDAVSHAIGHEKVGIQLPPSIRSIYMKPEPLTDVQYAYLVAELERRAQAGRRLAFIQIIEPRSESEFLQNSISYEYLYRLWDGPIIRSGDRLLHIKNSKELSYDDRTLLAFDDYFISNPDLVYRIEKGWALTKFNLNVFRQELNGGHFHYPNYQQCLDAGY